MDFRYFYQRPIDTLSKRFPQFSIGLMSMLWGAVLILPYETFATSQGYQALEGFAGEPIIGAVVALAGLLNIHGLISEGWWLHRKTSVFLMMFWVLATIVFFFSAPSSASWVLFLGLAWLHGWSAVVGRYACVCYDDHEH